MQVNAGDLDAVTDQYGLILRLHETSLWQNHSPPSLVTLSLLLLSAKEEAVSLMEPPQQNIVLNAVPNSMHGISLRNAVAHFFASQYPHSCLSLIALHSSDKEQFSEFVQFNRLIHSKNIGTSSLVSAIQSIVNAIGGLVMDFRETGPLPGDCDLFALSDQRPSPPPAFVSTASLDTVAALSPSLFASSSALRLAAAALAASPIAECPAQSLLRRALVLDLKELLDQGRRRASSFDVAVSSRRVAFHAPDICFSDDPEFKQFLRARNLEQRIDVLPVTQLDIDRLKRQLVGAGFSDDVQPLVPDAAAFLRRRKPHSELGQRLGAQLYGYRLLVAASGLSYAAAQATSVQVVRAEQSDLDQVGLTYAKPDDFEVVVVQLPLDSAVVAVEGHGESEEDSVDVIFGQQFSDECADGGLADDGGGHEIDPGSLPRPVGIGPADLEAAPLPRRFLISRISGVTWRWRLFFRSGAVMLRVSRDLRSEAMKLRRAPQREVQSSFTGFAGRLSEHTAPPAGTARAPTVSVGGVALPLFGQTKKRR